MEQTLQETHVEHTTPEAVEALPFPFNQQTFCRYESIEKTIEAARVLIVDNLLRDTDDLSAVAHREWGKEVNTELKREREIASLALQNIATNIERLVKEPTTEVAHLTEVATTAAEFKPDAIVLSGTLRDFDYYRKDILDNFASFIKTTRIPVLGICGGHQLIGLSFGARVLTLDQQEQDERRTDRVVEYQYRFVRILEPDDPIFQGLDNPESRLWPDYTRDGRVLRVWQNHGLQLDRVPEGFTLLATSYLCRNQMMVKRSDEQMIYSVQFHLEKSFEDWHKNPTRWEHPNESRDGRILFENFLRLALQNGEQ
ncbi:MAG TPA: gamma-glutamyl-gamma-aminobutyrate hydrolase family protein [Pyrinomonadaceae bacterium]|nr:gamma-glutamyl-gamma-aminobutyrate hydrolase family protein [Pyrinomonadaceae bacterium]